MSTLRHTDTSALFTDFYELTMAQGYWKNKMNYPAVFDMFFRRQPFNGGFSVFAGLHTLLEALETFSFSQEDIDYLSSLGIFEDGFLDYLKVKIESCCSRASFLLRATLPEYIQSVAASSATRSSGM